jgi:hypothetical protein
MAVVAALDDPLTVFLTDYFTDVVRPNHDGTDGGTTCIGSVVSP